MMIAIMQAFVQVLCASSDRLTRISRMRSNQHYGEFDPEPWYAKYGGLDKIAEVDKAGNSSVLSRF